MGRFLSQLVVAFLKVATPAAAGAVGLWLATSVPDVYRAICGG